MKPEPTTYDRALSLLAFRARSVAELRKRLLAAGAPAGEVETTIARLIDQKLLDDADFARQFARTRSQGMGASRLRIRQELGRKGVARSVADEAITELEEEDGVDFSASIHRVAERKWKTLLGGGLDAPTSRRRLYGFLARRGYSPDEIRAAMSVIGAETED